MPGTGEQWRSTDRRLKGLRIRLIEGFRNHLVFYRPTERGLEVIRVLHAARDIESALAEGWDSEL